MAKQFLGWYLVAVFLVWLNLFLQASAATGTVEVVALQDLYCAMNSPSQLKRWKLDTGDRCEERWTGMSCSGSSMIHLKHLVESLGGQLDNFHHMRRDVSSNNNLGEISDCLSPYAILINLACNKLSSYIPQPLSFLTYVLHLFDIGPNYPPGTFTLDNVSLLPSETSTQSSLEGSRTKKKRLSFEGIGSGVVLVVTIATFLFAIHIKQFHAPNLNSLERTSNPFIFLIWIANLFQCVTASRSLPLFVSTFKTKELSLAWVFVFFIIIAALIIFFGKGSNTVKKGKSKSSKKRNMIVKNDIENPKGENDDMKGKGTNDDVLHPNGKVDDVLHQEGEVDVLNLEGEVDDNLEIGDGRLLVYTKKEISSGGKTTVFEGCFYEQPVAVKRIPRELGKRETDILKNYHHRNVVVYHGEEEYNDSCYIALELCTCNLKDLLCQVSIKKELKAFQLWKPNQKNRPSVQLLQLMKDIAESLKFLHSNSIVHNDLKPSKILIKEEGGSLLAKLCGLGTSVDITNTGNTETQNATGADILSLGRVFFYCITQANYPFGEQDLFLIDQPEAKHLISRMIAADPKNRPSAGQVEKHPLFWNACRRIKFLVEADTEVRNAVAAGNQKSVQSCLKFNKTWATKLDNLHFREMNKYRTYKCNLVADLLRLIRNTYIHCKQLVGQDEEEQDYYFSSRFPELFINIYELLLYKLPCPADLEKYKWR